MKNRMWPPDPGELQTLRRECLIDFRFERFKNTTTFSDFDISPHFEEFHANWSHAGATSGSAKTRTHVLYAFEAFQIVGKVCSQH